MTITARHETVTRPGWRRRSLPVLAGLATVAVTTMAAVAGPVGILIGWLGGSVACGLVLLVARDERATRATLAMIVLLPASVPVGSIALAPLWSVGGPWATGVAQLLATGLTPTVAMAVAGRRPAVAANCAPGGRWVWLRAGLAVCTAAVVVTGHLVVQFGRRSSEVDAGFLVLLVADLVPVCIYVVGVRRPGTVMVSGYLLFAIVAASWALFRLEDGNQFAGVWVLFGWMVALAVAGAGAVRDYGTGR